MERTFFATIFVCFISCKGNKNEMNISKQDALEIAKEHNISGDSVEISYKTYTYPKSSLGYKKGKRKIWKSNYYYWLWRSDVTK